MSIDHARHYVVHPGDRAVFHNNACVCIGTGRMGLALQQEYMEELALTQKEIGFSYIRGHGLFCDDMGIYCPFPDAQGTMREGYNFTYLDRVIDSYLRLGLKPFLELGFMPDRLASGKQTIFYWRGNVTPPADPQKWAALIQALIRHLVARYGREMVATWPVEVWNEPNLSAFWENADRDAYLRLYDVSARAVKEALPEMRVGGPAVCGGETCLPWIRAFLEHCLESRTPVDFVTRHIYMGQQPERTGRYLYQEMCTPAESIAEAQKTRELIDSYPAYRGMELHITEFNTSYNPFCPTHDTIYNAALIAGMLAGLGDACASYSYWTFGDVFEESGVPDRPFHGGFGLTAGGSIPKPTFWAFQFFSKLRGTPLLKTDDCVVIRRDDGAYRAVFWNVGREEKKISLSLPEATGEWTVVTHTVDEEGANPLKIWHDLGEPASLSPEQTTLLRNAAHPRLCSQKTTPQNGALAVDVCLGPCAVMYAEITPRALETSPGYQYPGIG